MRLSVGDMLVANKVSETVGRSSWLVDSKWEWGLAVGIEVWC